MRAGSVHITFTFDVPSMAVWMHRIAEMQDAINGIERMRWEREWGFVTGEYWQYP